MEKEYMEKEYTLEEFIKKNNFCETKYDYTFHSSSSIGPSKIISFVFSKYIHDNKYIELISNPTIIFELDEDGEFEFDINYVFDNIELSIGGSQIDKLFNSQIKMYNRIYGLNVEKNGLKIFYPIPFALMNNGNGILSSKCKYNDIRLNVNFCSNKFVKMIKSCTIRTKLLIILESPDYSIINNQTCKCILSNYLDYYPKNLFITDLIKKHQNFTDTQLVKINQNQFLGIKLLQNLSDLKIKTYFNFVVDRFFICFVNTDDESIYSNTQQFETIKFIANGYDILEYDYQTLLNNNSKNILGYELPKGIFEIKWNVSKYWKNLSLIEDLTISLCGLTVPSNVGFVIFAESINWLIYQDNTCGLAFSN
jgi:hypothetical protein